MVRPPVVLLPWACLSTRAHPRPLSLLRCVRFLIHHDLIDPAERQVAGDLLRQSWLMLGDRVDQRDVAVAFVAIR